MICFIGNPVCTVYQAQLAAMEALASFGGSDLGSVSVKRRDLRDELKRETELLKSQDAVPEDSTKRPHTRWAVDKIRVSYWIFTGGDVQCLSGA